MKKVTFFSRFLAHFPLGGYPRSLPDPLGCPGGSQVDFLMVFRRPGEGFGTSFGPFGLPLGTLGATLGVTLAPKVDTEE